MTQKLYYKVVRKTWSEELFSYQMKDVGVKVKYEINKWVKPEISGSKLFVFNNFRSARLFSGDDSQIFQCYIKGTPTTLKNRCHTGWCDLVKYITFWKNRNNHKKQDSLVLSNIIPKGTVLVDQVKLLKKVW